MKRIGIISAAVLFLLLGNSARAYAWQEPKPKEEAKPAKEEPKAEAKADLSSLSSMLHARWKGGAASEATAEPTKAGQVRTFKIVKLDVANKKIELELV